MRGRGSGQSDEFIREVDEAVRQDRWLKLWKHYGAYVIGAALAVVIGSAAGVGWRAWQESQRQDEAERYMAAIELLRAGAPGRGGRGACRAGRAISSSGYAVLARLQAAQALGEAGDRAGKLSMLGQLTERRWGCHSVSRPRRASGSPGGVRRSRPGRSVEPAREARRRRTTPGATARWSSARWRSCAPARPRPRARPWRCWSSDPRTPPDLGRRAAELLSALGGPSDADAGAGAAASGDAPEAGAAPQEAEAAPQ